GRSFRQLLFNPITGIAAVLLVVIAFANSPVLRERSQGYLDSLAARLPEAAPPAVDKPDPVDATKPVDTATPTTTPLEHPVTTPEAPSAASERDSATPPPSELPKAKQPFPESLFRDSEESATASALSAVLAAWDKTSDGDLPTSLDADTLKAFAQRSDLAIEFLNPAIDQILALGLPAIVQLKRDEHVRTAALTAAKGDTLTLASGDTTWTMDRSAFRAHYTGDAIVLWDDPTPNAPTLMPGSSNGEVRKLRATLAKLGRIPSTGNKDRYDGAVSKAVARIQAETSLDVDGIAGKQVRMVLQSWSKTTGTPFLGSQLVRIDVADTPPPAAETAPKSPPNASPKPTSAPQDASEIVAKATEEPAADQGESGPDTEIPAVNPSNIGVKPTTAGTEPEKGDVSPSPATAPGAQLTVVELPDPGSSATPPAPEDPAG
ncbi:MAG: peptidoglycan-binding protein, partial [Candidatus Hydrogenedentes bacterium]|nr:peptidoglycan-binding protein [Candidatus Hydrogenedentota bacterium]